MIFVDTGFLFALASAKDPDHERVKEVFQSLQGQRLPDLLLTTNHVVFEAITLARYRIGHAAAVSMGEQLYSEKLTRIHWVSPDEEHVKVLARIERGEQALLPARTSQPGRAAPLLGIARHYSALHAKEQAD